MKMYNNCNNNNNNKNENRNRNRNKNTASSKGINIVLSSSELHKTNFINDNVMFTSKE